jgi:hypothetical protein
VLERKTASFLTSVFARRCWIAFCMGVAALSKTIVLSTAALKSLEGVDQREKLR